MRILAVAAFSIPYIRENWGDPLKHLYGDEVVCVNANPFLSLYSGRYLEQYLYRLVARDDFDYLFFYHDWIFADFSDEFFANLRRAGVRSAAFHPDDEPEVWYGKNVLYDHRYDLIASHSRNGVRRRAADGYDWAVHYMQWGYNPRFFFPAEGAEKRYDVVFIGKNKVYEHDESRFREDGRNRDEALSLLAEACEARGWVFRLFGFGWERHPTLSRFAGGVLTREQMVEVYQQTRVVFNPAWSSDDHSRVPQTKLRHFEVPGCGAFQITNQNAELTELFEVDREIAFFRDDRELVEKVAYYLGHDAEREAIARAGYLRASGEHTLDHRLRALFAAMAERWPPRPRPPGGVRIEQLFLRGRADGERLLARLEAEPQRLAGCDGVHFLAGDFRVEGCEYGGLLPFLRDDALPLLGVRSYLEIGDGSANPVQPTREEMRGELLLEEIHWDDLQGHNRALVRDRLPLVDDAWHSLALVNFVCRPAVAVPLLRAFLAGSVEAVRALRPFYTGVVVAELKVDVAGEETAPAAVPGPVYIQLLKRLLAKAARLGQRVAIYGARGEMARWAFTCAYEFPELKLVAVIDNGLVGEELAGVPIVGSGDLEALRPDLIVIAGAYSGPQMYESVRHLQGRVAVVPLYDRDDVVWGTLLP